MIEAGKLRHLVTLETPTHTLAADGSQTTAWATLATVYAEIAPVVGLRELQLAKTYRATTSHRVTIRYRVLANPTTLRVKFGTRTFEIDGVINPDERNENLVLYCTEGPVV